MINYDDDDDNFFSVYEQRDENDISFSIPENYFEELKKSFNINWSLSMNKKRRRSFPLCKDEEIKKAYQSLLRKNKELNKINDKILQENKDLFRKLEDKQNELNETNKKLMQTELKYKEIKDYVDNKSNLSIIHISFSIPSINEVDKNTLKDKENSIPYLPSNNSDTSNIKLSETQKETNKFNQNIKNIKNNNFNIEDNKNNKIKDLPKNEDKNKGEESTKDFAYENINEKENK
jgi:hypothetical protein